MRYGSVCSGIEAASVAWRPLGWEPVFVSEIEPFANAVLAHHYPSVPNAGDFTKIGAHHYGPIDLLVGGTPCQDFSIAGARAGIEGDRGQLTLEYVRTLDRLRPEWFVWENVPGVLSSDGGRGFGAFLGAVEELGYGWAYRILDAQYFGVPQRRRVFVVGNLRDRARAFRVLFESDSMRGDTAPSRKARPETSLLAGDGAGSGVTQSLTVGLASGGPDLAHAQAGWLVANTLQAEYGTRGYAGDETYIANTITASAGHHGHSSPRGDGSDNLVIAFSSKDSGDDAGEIAPTLRSMNVRRVTPRECERLQGFPDDYTLVPDPRHKGKLARNQPRYHALGNSMAVPCMRWIGERIEAVC